MPYNLLVLSASIRKYGDAGDPKKCHAMLTQPFEKEFPRGN